MVSAICNATCKADLSIENSPSAAGSTIDLKGLSPVPLTKGVAGTISKEAHLCPSTGSSFKCNTWLHVASAALGLACNELHAMQEKGISG